MQIQLNDSQMCLEISININVLKISFISNLQQIDSMKQITITFVETRIKQGVLYQNRYGIRNMQLFGIKIPEYIDSNHGRCWINNFSINIYHLYYEWSYGQNRQAMQRQFGVHECRRVIVSSCQCVGIRKTFSFLWVRVIFGICQSDCCRENSLYKQQ